MESSGRFIEKHIFRFQVKGAAARHGLPGVDKHIEQHLLDLPPVHIRRPEVRIVFFEHPDFPARPAEEPDRFGDKIVEIGGNDFGASRAGKSQKLPGQVGAALHQRLHG